MKYYFYPAIFQFSNEGISLTFPDLPQCPPHAHNLDEAIQNAKHTLKLYLENLKENGDEFPVPSRIEDLRLELNQNAILIETNICTSANRNVKVPSR